MNIIPRLKHYLQEACFCWRIGANLQTKVRLVYSMWKLHFQNVFGLEVDDRHSEAVSYQILINDKVQEIWMRPGSGDIFIFFEIFFLKCYEIPESKSISVKTFVDLGSNVGFTSLFFLQRWATSRCICVEPNPKNLCILKKNVQPWGEQVSILEGAIDSTAGIKSFCSEGWSYNGKLGSDGDLQVKTYTMADLFARYQINEIDVLKVDIEGAEEELFSSKLDWLNQIKYLVIELHGGLSKVDLVNRLKSFGFEDLRPDEVDVDFAALKNTQRL